MRRHKNTAPTSQIALFDAPQLLKLAPAGFNASNSDDVLVAGAKAKVWANLEAVRLLYTLEAEDRLPSPAEQAVLARYSAFGGFPKAFDEHPANPERTIHEAVKHILKPADYKAAKQSTPNAFYTSPEIIGAIWQYMAHLGFRGGRVLEPAAATGLFLAGMPQALRQASTLTAVELDRVSGRIGQLLHPDVEYHITGLQTVDLMRGTFDLITSNIPFGEYPVFDASFSAAEVALSKSIHNYFFIKAVQLARPGGLIAFVTSRYMMDAKNDQVRAYLAERCRLVGAVRLPSYAFRQFSGTDVVTDLVVLQKLDEGESAPAEPGWLGVDKVLLAGAKLLKEEFWINRYFTGQPERIMGELRCRTGAYAAQLTVAGDVDPEGLAERIVAALPAYSAPIYHAVATPAPLGLAARCVPFTDVRDGSYAVMVVGGVQTVYQKQGGAAVPVPHKGRKLARLIGQIDLVLDARRVVEQCLHGDDADLAAAQAQLNADYDRFVAEFGYLSEKANRALFAGDPNATFLLALEHYDATRNVARKTRLFSERTVRGHQRPTRAASAADALAISLNEYGSLNMPYMVELYGRDEDTILAELGDTVYFDPAQGAWVTSDEYLSGNVLEKLRAVEYQGDPDLDRNYAALTAVQPTKLLPEQITAGLGATWIPEYVVSQFAVELVDRHSLANHIDEPGYRTTHYGGTHRERYFRVQARYVPALSRWEVKPSNTQRYNELATRTWGTERRGVFDLLEAKLNGSEISVYDKDGDDGMVLNQTETIAAREKANAIAKLFARWVWMHPARRDDLAARYNEKFRCLVERAYDGSYLTFPNTSLDLPPFHTHQRNGIARALRGGNVLLWHAVGAGKSWTMIVTAMEMKRLGLRHKPIHVVPGHLLEQYAVEFYRVYPAARILVIDSQKMSPKERDISLARIATEDWDSVLITHSAFQRIPLQIKTWEWLIETQVAELEESMQALKGDDERKFTVKRMEAKKLALQAKLEERRSRAAQNKTGLTFEEIGIDMIIVDECFPWETRILTDQGWLPIGQVVDNKMPVKVLTKNLVKGVLEWKPIVRWLKREGQKQLVRVVHERGEFTCTEDHKIWTQERGYVKAKELAQEDTLCLLRDGLRPQQGAATVLPGRVQGGVVDGASAQATGGGPLPALPEGVYQEHGQPYLLQRGMPGSDEGLYHPPVQLLRQTVSCAQERPGEGLQSLLLTHVPQGGPEGDDYQALPTMRRGILIQVGGQDQERGAKVLLEAVRGDLAAGAPDGACIWGPAGAENAGVGGAETSHFRADEGEQSIQTARSASEDKQGEERAHVLEPGREFADYDPAADAGRGAVGGGIYGICHPDQAGQGPVSIATHQLQSGRCHPQDQAGHRGGWEVAQESEMAILGQAQNGGLTSARLVRVEVLERRDNEQPGGVRPQGQPVYDIEVEGNHNFFAEGALVSNCHVYKNLYFNTLRGHIAGIGGSDAGIAYDMFIKSQYVTRRCTAGHILGERRTECQCGAPRAAAGSLIGATGTAITNSISEMYTLMRYFQMDDLIAVGLDAFDAWASQFGDTKWVVEMEASGRGWRTKERFIEFFNVPELLLLFRQVADICIDQATLRLARPLLAGGAPKPVAIQPSSALLRFIDKCAARAEALEHKKPWEDNMLAIMGDSGRAATDLRLVDIMLDLPGSKINAVVDNVFRIWQETSAVTLPGLDEPVGLTQLVFLDVGVPGGTGFPLYADMKAKWVARGVPAAQIAFAHDAKTDAEKKELYNNVNAGRVRIVLGTTGKLGAGVNIQRLMVSLHHVDAPWTPALMEQREGRIWRPGNLNDVVVIYRYIGEKTLDFHRWHLLELKAAANLQLLTSGDGARRVSDLDQAVISFAEMRALATGNPLVVEQVHLRADLNVLYALYSKFTEQHRQLRLDVANIPSAMRWHEEQIEHYEAAVAYRAKWTAPKGHPPNLVVQGKAYAKRSEAAEHLQALINNALYNTPLLHMGYAEVSLFRGTGKRVYARVKVGTLTMDVELGESGLGNLTRIENEIDDMPKVVQYHRQWIVNEQARLARLEAELATFAFAREGEMRAKEARLSEIDRELASLASHDHVEAPPAETEEDENEI